VSAVDPSSSSPLSKVTDRVGNLVELLTTLDKRILATLDSLEEMRSAVGSLSDGGEDLVADIRRRMDSFDERINADMDEIKTELLARLGEMDGLGDRFDRLELSLSNIEKATVHLDQTMSGMVESLPDFLSRRIKPEGEGSLPST
jgi:hypothetical protein